jgi:hypothetical protein
VILSGFVRTGNQWKALLAVKLQNPDPRGRELTYYLTLAEGEKKTAGSDEKQAVVELVKARAEQEEADILNSGIPMTLSMKENGYGNLAASGLQRGSAVVLRIPEPPVPISPVHSKSAPVSPDQEPDESPVALQDGGGGSAGVLRTPKPATPASPVPFPSAPASLDGENAGSTAGKPVVEEPSDLAPSLGSDAPGIPNRVFVVGVRAPLR